MVTKLSPELKSHIEEYIDEIEQNRVFHSIIKCPVNILHDYLNILQMIDTKPMAELNPYIRVALCLASKTVGVCRCSKIDFLHDEFNFEFEIHHQKLNWGLLQKALIIACPQHRVRSNINHEYGRPMTTIQVSMQPIDKFRF